MRKPKNTAELFHYWANMVLPEAKCGNVRYAGPVLYSYAEPIAILLPNNRVLISDANFSVTTSSHQHAARVATHHMRRCYAPHLTHYYNELALMHKSNKDTWFRQAESAVAELKNHPRRKKSVGDRLTSILGSYHSYREFFELDWPELSSDEMRALVDERATERAAEEARRQAAAVEAQLRREAEEVTELLFWRNHQTERRSFSKMALRLSLDGTEIETTRGARVPVGCAETLWGLATSCKSRDRIFVPPGEAKVGPYSLDRVDPDGTLHIGCHTIPFDELELMAKKLNFIKENSNGIESDRTQFDSSVCEPNSSASIGECRPAA